VSNQAAETLATATNLFCYPHSRVCEVVLNGDKTFSLTQKKFKVSETLKQGEATTLFGALSIAASAHTAVAYTDLDYIADSVDSFLTSHAKTDYNNGTGAGDAVYLGFTFSFPVEQTALAKGKILTWTKGYAAKNAVGNDVVQLLQDAFDRKHMHVKCIALVNDVRSPGLLHFDIMANSSLFTRCPDCGHFVD
jgi:hexokinase